jgi:hypothetical protein
MAQCEKAKGARQMRAKAARRGRSVLLDMDLLREGFKSSKIGFANRCGTVEITQKTHARGEFGWGTSKMDGVVAWTTVDFAQGGLFGDEGKSNGKSNGNDNKQRQQQQQQKQQIPFGDDKQEMQQQ